jgi:hypothetical protein
MAVHCPELDLLHAGTIDQAASASLSFKLLAKVVSVVPAATCPMSGRHWYG